MISIIKRFININEINLLDGQLGYCKEDDTLYVGTENSIMPMGIIKRFNDNNFDLLNGQLGYCKEDDTLYVGLENKRMPISIIKRFNSYETISLLDGQLGFCLEDQTLYIGTETGFTSVSSDAASVGDLKEKVTKLREDADNIFDTLDQRATKALALLDQAKTAKDYLDSKADSIDTKHENENTRIENKYDTEVTRLDNKIDVTNTALITKIDIVDERLDIKIDSIDLKHVNENERIDNRIDSTNEVLDRPLMYKSTFPDYVNIEDVNRFDNQLSWTVEENGYVLVTVKGLCDFEVLIDNKPVIRKVLGDDPTRTDQEVIFSQIFHVTANSVISINEISKTYASYTCQFIPHKLEGVGAFCREDQQDIVDLLYPVGSIYLSMAATNPGILFKKGNWSLIAPGRVLVGIDIDDVDFDETRKVGGAKTHTLTESQMPSHTHIQNPHNHTVTYGTVSGGEGTRYPSYSGQQLPTTSVTAVNQNTGGGNAHNNLQPYLTCYMWERIT